MNRSSPPSAAPLSTDRRPAEASEGMWSLEKMLLRVDEHPWSAVYRVAVGALILPATTAIIGDGGALGVPLVFLAVLASLRVGPAVVRRLLPFSAEARRTWAERRQLAVRYDSYQWQKLLWIGLGMAGSLLLMDDVRVLPVVIASVSIVGGTLGLVVWRVRKAEIAAAGRK